MKKKLFVCIITLSVLLNACEEIDIEPARVQSFSILSTNTGTNYQIQVVVPKDYNPNVHYETVYVLDGNASYLEPEKIANIADKLSVEYQKQNVVVVGISSEKDRSRDFTPTQTSYGEGGSEYYSKFIEFELIPRIELNYHVDTTAASRVLIGHSLGGLLSGYFFTRHPDVFHNYIMLSPSFWYDDHVFFNYEQANRTVNTNKKTLVFIGCGELEETTVVEALEWKHRLSTFYPNSKNQLYILKNRFHQSSALENVEIGMDFYFKNN